MGLEVVALEPKLFGDWSSLFGGYCTFYERTLTDEIAERVWRWLQDPSHELDGVLVIGGGVAVGLAHFRRMPSPSRGCDIGFLVDLFVAEAARASGVGRLLIEHVQGVAAQRGWPIVRWMTADNNYRARALYDQVARKTTWNVYEMDTSPSDATKV